MRGLSLFSGIGGIDLACEWAGIETVAMCEREPFCQKVLRKHWPDVPIYDDVCTLTKERLEADGIGTIDLIHGGYPCQPFSLAGKRKGAGDDRHLWPEVFRLIQEVRPRWFVGENVPGHITMGIDIVLSDLASIGYTAEPIVLPAAAVGAPHRRERVFVLAYANDRYEHEIQRYDVSGSSGGYAPRNDWWEVEPAVGRMVDGVSARLDPYHEDRLKALGNAVVPQQIYPILAAIKEIDKCL